MPVVVLAGLLGDPGKGPPALLLASGLVAATLPHRRSPGHPLTGSLFRRFKGRTCPALAGTAPVPLSSTGLRVWSMISPDVQAELRRVTELVRARGLQIHDLQDLLKGRLPSAIVPVLIMALAEVETATVREIIVRALTDPAARGLAAKPLIRELERARADRDELLAWAIGNALCQVGDDSVSDDILDALRDPTLGNARETLAESLGRVRKRPEVVQALVALLDEGHITGHAIRALGKLGAWEARAKVEPFLTHKMPWVRKEATKALERMEKAQASAEREKESASRPRGRSVRG